jgi:hypothetical protein
VTEVAYNEENIEDWDFRHCSPDDPAYDPEADLFLSTNYTTVLAVDSLRLSYLEVLLEDGRYATLTEDGQHIILRWEGKPMTPRQADDSLKGLFRGIGGASRLTHGGRFVRRVRKSLRDEYRKYGQLKLTLLPTPKS